MASWRSPETLTWKFHKEVAVRRTTYKHLGNTDLFISKLALGGGPFGDLYGRVRDAEAIIVEGIRNGINLVDTSFWSGQVRSEEILGKALSAVPRSAFYLTTKVGRSDQDFGRTIDLRAERVLAAVDASLRRLRTPYLDLLQVQLHDHEFGDSLQRILEETLPAVDCVRYSGKARYIALTGYSLENIRRVLELSRVRIDAVVSYGRGTMADQSLSSYIPYFKSRGLGVINASCTGLGLLRPEGPPAWHPAPPAVRAVAAAAAAHCEESGLSLARLATSFSLGLSGVDCTLAGAGALPILRQNLDTSWFALSSEEFRCRRELMDRRNHRTFTTNVRIGHPVISFNCDVQR